MKIAIIAYNHPESSIPLAHYLSITSCYVDYYFITRQNSSSSSAFDFRNAPKKLGIIKLDPNSTPQIFHVWNKTNFRLNLFRLFFLPFKCPPLINRIIQKRLISKEIREINHENYDVINFIGQAPLLKYLNQKLIAKVKIHSLHEVIPHYSSQRLSKSFVTFLLRKQFPIILHSNASKELLLSYKTHINKQKIFTIPFGLFETYSTINRSNIIHVKKDFLLFYGRIKPYKGLSLLYKAFQILNNKNININLVIAGAGYDEYLENFRKFSNCTIINRHLLNEEIAELNIKAKAIVCPYLSASQSGIVQTTFLFKKPIIATNVGGFPEIIINNVNGILIEKNNEFELANAIEAIFTNKTMYNTLVTGVQTFNTNQAEYSWESIADRTYLIMKNLLINEDK